MFSEQPIMVCLPTGNAAVQTLRSSGPVGLRRKAAYNGSLGILAVCFGEHCVAVWLPRVAIENSTPEYMHLCVCRHLVMESSLTSKVHASSKYRQVESGLGDACWCAVKVLRLGSLETLWAVRARQPTPRREAGIT